MAIKFGHRMQTAVFYGFAMMLLTFVMLNIAITGINIMAGNSVESAVVVFDPIGLPLFAGGIVFFLTVGIASSDTMDAKAKD